MSCCNPQIIFTETAVEDGSWLTIPNKAEKA
jgi:hypothetical protein